MATSTKRAKSVVKVTQVSSHRPQTCINLSPQFPQDKYLVNHVSACKHLFYYNTITFLQLLICLFKKMTSQPVPKTS